MSLHDLAGARLSWFVIALTVGPTGPTCQAAPPVTPFPAVRLFWGAFQWTPLIVRLFCAAFRWTPLGCTLHRVAVMDAFW